MGAESPGLFNTSQNMSSVRGHPMNADLGSISVPEVESGLTLPSYATVTLLGRIKDGEQSFVGIRLLYNHKDSTSLQPLSLTFYPLHASQLNFENPWSREWISTGNSILACLPACFMDTSAALGEGKKSICPESEPMLLQALHKSIVLICSKLKRICQNGIRVMTRDRMKYRCHSAFTSYVEDILETMDLLSFMHVVLTLRPGSRWILEEEKLDTTGDYYWRNIHNLHHAVPKMLKECEMERPGDTTFKTKFLFRGTTERSFPSIKRSYGTAQEDSQYC